jgi:SAM-dependent methyltransferase
LSEEPGLRWAVKLADRTILTSPEFQTGQVSPHVLRSLGKAVRFLASSRGTLRENAVTYVIKGGREGKNRLSVIADALQPTTARLIDKAGKIEAETIVDAACGGGDVCLYLADLAGPTGKVVGFDLDGEKLAIAREQANARGLSNIEFVQANVLAPWPVEGADLVYARFILTHLTEPERFLERATAALRPGGHLIVEDIDYGGRFTDPECAAITRADDLYINASRRNGGDPFIGRRLHRLIESAGFVSVETSLAQPFGRSGSAKETVRLTLGAIADRVVANGIASREEVDTTLREVEAFTAKPDTMISMPRIFQAIAVRPT